VQQKRVLIIMQYYRSEASGLRLLTKWNLIFRELVVKFIYHNIRSDFIIETLHF
jgi:hypothetical protein